MGGGREPSREAHRTSLASASPSPPLREKLRLRWRGLLLDAACATLCLVLAYWLRFPGSEALHFLQSGRVAFVWVLTTHLGALAAARLYMVHGQPLWPIRLLTGTALGVPAGVLSATWLTGGEGVSRQAMLAYALLFLLVATGWRAALGLRSRWLLLRATPVAEGELEVRGVHHRSMTGGLLLALQYRHLLRNLVIKDLKLKYRGSVLGVLWSMLNPLVMILVYTFAFTYVLGVRTPQYAFFVLLGLLSWIFFSGTVIGSTDAIAEGGRLLKSVLFPRVILPVSGALFHLVQFLLTLLVFLPVMLLLHGVPLGSQMLLFPVFLGLNVLFVIGIALTLSTATVFFRDIKHLVEVGLNIAFWLTPILYEQTMVPEQYRAVLLLSPMASFVRAYQDLFYYLTWPDSGVWLVAVVYGMGGFVCGVSVFIAYEDRFAEQV